VNARAGEHARRQWPPALERCNTRTVNRLPPLPASTVLAPGALGWMCGLLACGLAAAQQASATITSFEHWSLECGEERPGRSDCSLFQNVVLGPEQGGGRVMRVTIGLIDGDPTPVALFVLPLGISLPPGVELQVGGADAVHFPVERCEPSGCGGGLRLDATLLDTLRSGDTATVRFRDSSRQPVELQLSLRGFAAGLEALTGTQPPP